MPDTGTLRVLALVVFSLVVGANALAFRQEFPMFGEATYLFVIPAQEDADLITIDLSTMDPGMADHNEGRGFSLTNRMSVQVNQETDKL